MTRRCRCRRPRCHHGSGWLALLVILLFPLWLALWAGCAIHARWGKRGVWIYVGALCITAALHNAFGPATPPPQPPQSPVVVVTVTSTVNR